eukprot:12924620-Prorocentrum_lima.AAC.1
MEASTKWIASTPKTTSRDSTGSLQQLEEHNICPSLLQHGVTTAGLSKGQQDRRDIRPHGPAFPSTWHRRSPFEHR